MPSREGTKRKRPKTAPNNVKVDADFNEESSDEDEPATGNTEGDELAKL